MLLRGLGLADTGNPGWGSKKVDDFLSLRGAKNLFGPEGKLASSPTDHQVRLNDGELEALKTAALVLHENRESLSSQQIIAFTRIDRALTNHDEVLRYAADVEAARSLLALQKKQ